MRSHWLWLAELSFPCPLAVIFNVSTCIQAREHDSNLCNGHRQDVPSGRCWGEHRWSSRVITAGSRWQCSGLRCGRSSDSIAEETDSSPDPEEERQQHSCSLLSISLTSEFAHTALLWLSLSQSSFFFGAKRYQEKGISRGLIDRSTHAWGFNASNPSWVKHHRMHQCVVATPFFLFHYPYGGSGIKKKKGGNDASMHWCIQVYLDQARVTISWAQAPCPRAPWTLTTFNGTVHACIYKGQKQLSCNLFCNHFVSLSPHITLILGTGTFLSAGRKSSQTTALYIAQCVSNMYRLRRRESVWSLQPSNVVSTAILLRSRNDLTHEWPSWVRLKLPFVIIHAADLRLRGRHRRQCLAFQLRQ